MHYWRFEANFMDVSQVRRVSARLLKLQSLFGDNIAVDIASMLIREPRWPSSPTAMSILSTITGEAGHLLGMQNLNVLVKKFLEVIPLAFLNCLQCCWQACDS